MGGLPEGAAFRKLVGSGRLRACASVTVSVPPTDSRKVSGYSVNQRSCACGIIIIMSKRTSSTGTKHAGKDRREGPKDRIEAEIRNADELSREKMARSIPSESQIGIRPSFDPPAEPEWHRMIAEAAYFRAEKRNFDGGHALDDWLLAEQEVKRIISP